MGLPPASGGHAELNQPAYAGRSPSCRPPAGELIEALPPAVPRIPDSAFQPPRDIRPDPAGINIAARGGDPAAITTVTDGNPNPIRWFANLSLVGASPIRGRDNDTVGIGHYHLGVSNLPILTIHGIGAENGEELFYNAAVTPWFHLTPDMQMLDPANRSTATALLVGIRGRLSF